MPYEIRGVDVEKYALLCQETSPKRWFGNMEMTSSCDVTNSEHQIQMTTIWPWTKPPPWKFSAYATAATALFIPICHCLVYSFIYRQNCLALFLSLLNECGFITDTERSMNCSRNSVYDLPHLFCCLGYSGSARNLSPCPIIKSNIWCLEEKWNWFRS